MSNYSLSSAYDYGEGLGSNISLTAEESYIDCPGGELNESDSLLESELYGRQEKWDLTSDIQEGEHILTIEVIPQPQSGIQHVIFFTDRNNRYATSVPECKDGAKMRSIQAEDNYELCDIEWKNGTVFAVQRMLRRGTRVVQRASAMNPAKIKKNNLQDKRRHSAGGARGGNKKSQMLFGALPPINSEELLADPFQPGSPNNTTFGDEFDELPQQDLRLENRFSSRMSDLGGGQKKHIGVIGAASTFWEPGIVCSGYYEKRGGGNYSRAWRRRFFVLNKSREIHYFESDKCSVPKGEFNIPMSAELSVEDGQQLSIRCKDRTWVFRFNSNEERDRWLNATENLKHDEDWGNCVARGLIGKRGKMFGGWKKPQYAKLYDSMILKYFNDENCSMTSGVTELKEVKECICTESKDIQWPYAFNLIEDNGRSREYRVRTLEERIMWVSQINRYISMNMDLMN